MACFNGARFFANLLTMPHRPCAATYRTGMLCCPMVYACNCFYHFFWIYHYGITSAFFNLTFAGSHSSPGSLITNAMVNIVCLNAVAIVAHWATLCYEEFDEQAKEAEHYRASYEEY